MGAIRRLGPWRWGRSRRTSKTGHFRSRHLDRRPDVDPVADVRRGEEAFVRIHRDLLQIGSSAFTMAELAVALVQHGTGQLSIESSALLDALQDLGFLDSLPSRSLDSIESMQLASQIINQMDSPIRVVDAGAGKIDAVAGKFGGAGTVAVGQLPANRVRAERIGHFDEFGRPLADEEPEAAVAGQTIEHSLAALFLRLGPPPEPTGIEYMPAGSGGGGAHL